MAEEFTPQMHGFADPAAENAENAVKLAAQDINGKTSVGDPESHASTFDALDALVEEKRKETAPTEEEKKAAEDAAAKIKAEEEAKAKADAEAKAKADAEAGAGEVKPDEAPSKDELFKDVQLPPGTRPKSAEAFAVVKERAMTEITAREKRIAELSAELKAAKEAAGAKGALPPEVEKELQEHREWRAKLDVDADPKFKEYTAGIAKADEFIYAQLRRAKLGDDVIAEIKKHGGPASVKMEKIFAAINDPTAQRIIEAKLSDIELMKFNRDEAVKEAKENIKTYLEAREKEFSATSGKHHEQTAASLKQFSDKLTWMAPIVPPANADDAAKKSAETHNQFIAEINGQMQEALKDDSPEMRALMIVGMAQLQQYQRVLATTRAEKEVLAKQVEELTSKLDRFKGASVSRLRESAAPPGGKLPPKASDSDLFKKSAGEALDDLARQQAEERAKA